MLGDNVTDSLCVHTWVRKSWTSGGWVSWTLHPSQKGHILHILFASCTSFLLYTFYSLCRIHCVFVEDLCCDVISEKIPACCMFCSLHEGEQFLEGQQGCAVPLVCLNSLPHDKPLHGLLGQWGSPIASLSASGLECLQTRQCQFGGRMSALEFMRHRTDQSPGPWLPGCDVVYLHVQTEGARSVAFFMEYHSVCVFGC